MELQLRLVRDLMKVGVPTCPPDTPIREIARIFHENNLEAIIVLDPEEGHALGVVSQDELVGALLNRGGSVGSANLTAADIMIEDIPQLPPDIPLETAAQWMHDRHLRMVFLMHHAGGIVYPAAYLSYQQLIRLIGAQSQEELRDLGIGAARKTPLEAFNQRREEAKLKRVKHSKP